jgi:hypothetical protein
MPKVVFRNAVELAFWGYVTAIKSTLPSVTLKVIVANFRKDFEFDLDQFPEQSALKLWTRLQDEARQFKAEKRGLDPSLFEPQSEKDLVHMQKEILKQVHRINAKLE